MEQLNVILDIQELKQYADGGLQLPLPPKKWGQLQEYLAKGLVGISGDQEKVVKSLRLLDSGGLLKDVVCNQLLTAEHAETADASARDNFMELLSIILQFTDQAKLRMLQYLVDHKHALDLLKHLDSPKQLYIIFRLFDAEPFLRTLWDTSPLYAIELEKLNEKDRMVCQYLLRMVHNNEA
jgi:hypothetical protein